MNEFRTCYGYDDIFLVPRYSDIMSRNDCDTKQKFDKLTYKLPIIMSPMDTVCCEEFIRFALDTNTLAPSIHRYYKSVEDQLELVNKFTDFEKKKIWVSVGSSLKPENRKWIDLLYKNGVRKFLIDMAHGDSCHMLSTIKYIKETGDTNVIGGAVCTKSGFERLQEHMGLGDAIRVGIGSGSICATSGNTAFGVPQVTAIQDCASVKRSEITLIADGGIKNAGDICKALAVGADFVMCGKILASTSLACGQRYDKNKNVTEDFKETRFREYRGMASKEARAAIMQYASVEGVSGLVEYLGESVNVLNDVKLNIQASLSYAGVKNWQDFRRKVKIVRVAQGGYFEKMTHIINKE